jgi:hypothetical protein
MGDRGLGGSVVEMPDDAPQKSLWEVRKAGLNIMMSLKGDGKPVSFIEDCAVPLEHLAEYTDGSPKCSRGHGTHGTWYAHASVGTLHVRPILDMRRGGPEGGAAKMRSIANEASELVRKFKGAYSGEHGDGLCRGEWIAWQFGPQIDDAFRAIKTHLDPIGCSIPARSSTRRRWTTDRCSASRRRARRSRTADPDQAGARLVGLERRSRSGDRGSHAPGTGGDVTGGFAMAVEMCNNNGHCRKFDAGTMCPSYRVTRDEQHLTRGRANTLRLALSGQLGPDAFTSDEMYETLDLCVSCKGCRRDCPTGVDMAKMKIEFLAHYKAKHGYTLKDRLIAGLPSYARLASRMPWLFNCARSLPGRRGWATKLLGLSPKRSLPRWRSDTFWRFRRRSSRSPTGERADRAAAAARSSRSSSIRSTAHSKARMRSPRCACCRRPAISSIRR